MPTVWREDQEGDALSRSGNEEWPLSNARR